MQLSIIIVSWNVRDLLQRCLESIYRHTHNLTFEVFVIDNASHDGSADMVAKHFPHVHLIRNTENRGFAAANNQGFARASAEYVLFLNDDTEITENIFSTLVKKFETLPKNVGMLGCRLLNSDGSLQPSVRRFPTWKDQTILLLKLHHLWPSLLNHYLATDFDYNREQFVDQVMGAFMFARREVIEQFGGLDESFFVWFEEVDLQKRMREQGLTVLYTPSERCIHAHGQSFKQLPKPSAQRLFNTSMRTYFKKHHSMVAYLWLSMLHPVSMLLSYVIRLVRTA